MSDFRLMVRCPVCRMTARGNWTARSWDAEPDAMAFLFKTVVNWQRPSGLRQARWCIVTPLEAVREIRALSPVHARQLSTEVSAHLRRMASQAEASVVALNTLADMLEREAQGGLT